MDAQKYAPSDKPIHNVTHHGISCYFFLYPPPTQKKYKAKNGNNVVVGGVVKGNFGDLEEDIREGLKFGLGRNLMMWW